MLRRIVWTLIAVAVLAGGLRWLFPPLQHTFRIIALLREPPPAQLPLPVADAQLARLVDTYGAPRSGGRRHEGIDIFAPRHTPVLSTTRGVIVRRGDNRLGGRVVMVLGPGGRLHYYAHLEAFSELPLGAWVEPGLVLGYVGNSGNAQATPPHLHYGIYQPGGGAIDPYPLLRPTG